jgi:hypothetical protein
MRDNGSRCTKSTEAHGKAGEITQILRRRRDESEGSEVSGQITFWEPLNGDGGHYNIFRIADENLALKALRLIFPNAQADDLNFVLFSTSGVHGTYRTIEEEEKEPGSGVTFLVVHPRIVSLRYGAAYPKDEADFEFLRRLRKSSLDVIQTIGF